MKNVNDGKIYLAGGLVTIVAAVFLAVVSFYSILVVEPRVDRLLTEGEKLDRDGMDLKFREAYLVLRNPQLFAGYTHFDMEGVTVKNVLMYFDRKVYNGEYLEIMGRDYLQLLLRRRMKGSTLGRNTMVFMLVVSLAFWIAYAHERRSVA